MKRIYRYIKILASAIQPALALMVGSLAAGFLSAACNKESDPVPSDGRYVIAFDEVTTKALITDETLTSFNVWGETESGKANVFDGVTITGSKGSAWTYEDDNDVRYWLENKTYNFFAIAPLGLGTGVVYDPEKGWGVNFNVVESMVADDQVDFILAQAQRTTGNITSPPDPVELGFTHKLSKVKLKLKKDNGNANQMITLKEVYIYGMKGDGTYYLDSGWSLGANIAGVSRTNMSEVLGTEDSEIGEALMIPQSLSEDSVYLIASFDYTNNEVTTPRIQIAPIPVDAVDDWEENKTYTYTAVLSVEHDIVFEGPTIQNWLSHSEGGTIVIK